MSFLKNIWYMAGWADEVADSAPLARRIAGVDLVFFRDAEGDLHCLADMCPHRFAPLSMGRVEQGRLICAYHGLGFGGGGRCLINPHGPITDHLKATSYQAVERHACLWVWLGAPELADIAKIPPMDFIAATSPEARVTGYLLSKAHYMLMVDNIMDLSHADYLHAGSLGGGINSKTKGMVSQEADGAIAIRWHVDNEELPPLMAQSLPEGITRGDFRNEVYWYAPGAMKQSVLFGPHGQLANQGRQSWGLHNMTPADETSTHYFFCHTSADISRNPAMVPHVRAVLMQAFAGEDCPVLEAQQRRIDGRDFWSLHPALLPTDAGAVRVRRRIDEMLRQEAAA